MPDTERNKQRVERPFEAFRSGDTNAFDDLIVEDYVQHNPQADHGLRAVKEFFAPAGRIDVEVHRWPASTSSAQRRGEDHRAVGRPTSGPGDHGERERHVQPAFIDCNRPVWWWSMIR